MHRKGDPATLRMKHLLSEQSNSHSLCIREQRVEVATADHGALPLSAQLIWTVKVKITATSVFDTTMSADATVDVANVLIEVDQQSL